MKNKTKGIICICLAMLGSFTYGIYALGTFTGTRTIEPHRWVLTGMFGLMFLLQGIYHLSKSHED